MLQTNSKDDNVNMIVRVMDHELPMTQHTRMSCGVRECGFEGIIEQKRDERGDWFEREDAR